MGHQSKGERGSSSCKKLTTTRSEAVDDYGFNLKADDQSNDRCEPQDPHN
jgi:hypothetical protein